MTPAPGRPRGRLAGLLALLLAPGVSALQLHQSQAPSLVSEATAVLYGKAPKKVGGVPLSAATLRRAAEQLQIAQAAEVESMHNAKSLQANQQELVAEMALDKATEAFSQGGEAIPTSHDAYTEARKWAIKAQQHADHIKTLVNQARKIPDEAAEAAAEAIQTQVRQEAYKAAEDVAAKASKEAALQRPHKIAAAVAAAAEPYHLALLRVQKEAAVDGQKAQKAAQMSLDLSAQAHQMAVSAQSLQAQGMGLQAQQLMAIAHSTMIQAVDLKGAAESLYALGNKLLGSLGGYQFQLASAAGVAANMVGVPVIPPLPVKPAEDDAAAAAAS